MTIPPAPASHLRGHPKETLEQLEASRGRWNPHFVHRPHRALPGTWGRWDSDPTSDVVYGFEPVKAFLYTGKKANPEDCEFLKHGSAYHQYLALAFRASP